MLTLFALPKPFRGHIATIQRNAIGSWVRLHFNYMAALAVAAKAIYETEQKIRPQVERAVEKTT